MRDIIFAGGLPLRKINALQILTFNGLLAAIVGLTALSIWAIAMIPGIDALHGIVLWVLGIVLFYGYALLVFRLFLGAWPLRAGEVSLGSQQEFVYHVYLLFLLMLFHPIIRGGILPVPLMRPFYQAMGARLGPNTYSSGILFDPLFISIGANTIVGHGALIIPHAVEGERLAFYPISIGDNVTIGAYATLLGGVTVGDGAIISIGAVVTKGSRVGAGEVWTGMPARRAGIRSPERSNTDADAV